MLTPTIDRKKKTLMFYCQHVLGMGHVVRSLEIVKALESFDVTFINGGAALPDLPWPSSIKIVNLPAITSDGEFEALHISDPSQSLERLQTARRDTLLTTVTALTPDVLMLELFPFGRIRFANELLPLLAHIRLEGMPTTVICSLRDILVGKSDQVRHDEWVASLINRYFDGLLVHADPQFQKLEETFSRTQDITCPITYTGFVAQTVTSKLPAELPGLPDPHSQTPLIVVSIGGGRVGIELLESAIRAYQLLTTTFPCRMMIFSGPYLPEEHFSTLQTMIKGHAHISLMRYSSDFLSYLQLADLSISMAGYNTCMNVVSTGTKALMLPFQGRGNQEQTIRAMKLEALGFVKLISKENLQPKYLCPLMHDLLNSKAHKRPSTLDTQGATNTEKALRTFLEQGTPTHLPQLRPLIMSQYHTDEWQKEFTRALETFQERGKTIHLFLRDDDIDSDESTLRTLCDITISHGIPLNLEVIPGRLTPETIRFLKNLKRIDPSLIGLDQHGWCHTNHEKEGRKCEFGISRSFEEQLKDISAGKATLEEALGERFFPAFTPPWNRMTEDTCRVLDELGFLVLSKDRGKHPVTGYRFREISTTLDLYQWQSGATMKAPEAIAQALTIQFNELEAIGLLLHHKVMDEEAFSFLNALLKLLRAYPCVQFHTFQTLLEFPQPAVSLAGGQ